jgi:hypothetical protein
MWWRLRLVTSAVSGVALAASAAGATGVDARGEAAVSVSAFRLSPARAGRALQPTLLLTRAGSPARPDRVVCAAAAGGKRLAGRAVRLANGGRYLWTLAASSRGKRAAGSISATKGGKTLSRRFVVLAR